MQHRRRHCAVLTQVCLQIIHLHGFSSAEREHYRQQIFQNVCGAMRMVLDAMDLFNLALDEAVASRHTQFIEETIRKPRCERESHPAVALVLTCHSRSQHE